MNKNEQLSGCTSRFCVHSEEVVNAPSRCKRFWGNIGIEESKITDYCANVIYQDGKRMLLVDGGYVTFNDNDSLSYGEGWGGACYHYYLKDHLGNNRVVVGELRKDKKKMAKLYRRRSSRVNG